MIQQVNIFTKYIRRVNMHMSMLAFNQSIRYSLVEIMNYARQSHCSRVVWADSAVMHLMKPGLNAAMVTVTVT